MMMMSFNCSFRNKNEYSKYHSLSQVPAREELLAAPLYIRLCIMRESEREREREKEREFMRKGTPASNSPNACAPL
jgi:hypothetical protein